MRGKRFAALAGVISLIVTGGCSAGASSTPSASSSRSASAAPSSAASSAAGASTSTSVTSDASAATVGRGDGALAIGFVLEPTTLDFTQTAGAPITQALLLNVYETLVKQDQDGKIVPLLAKSWTVSDDRLTYDFTLQSGVKFTNGADFSADDAVFSINRVKTDWKPAVKAGMDIVSSAAAVSPTEVKVVLTRPSTSWLFTMTTAIGAMFAKTGVADLSNTPVGTGPYAFKSWSRGDSIVMERNKAYWGTAPSIKTMTLKYFQDPNAMNSALLTGGIQIMSAVQTPESLAQFSDTSKYRVINGSSTGKVILGMNNRTGPLADPRVRQAISHALDRKSILDTAWSGYGSLIGTNEAPTDPWFTEVDKYPYDPQKAKDLLAQAGVGNLTLRFTMPPVPYATAAAPIVISQLAAVGITLQESDVDFNTWISNVYTNHDFDLTIINHVEPRDSVTLFGSASYYFGYDNQTVRDLFTKADQELSDDAASADYQQALDQIATDAPVVWLWSFPNLEVADANVAGIVKNQISAAFELASISVG